MLKIKRILGFLLYRINPSLKSPLTNSVLYINTQAMGGVNLQYKSRIREIVDQRMDPTAYAANMQAVEPENQYHQSPQPHNVAAGQRELIKERPNIDPSLRKSTLIKGSAPSQPEVVQTTSATQTPTIIGNLGSRKPAAPVPQPQTKPTNQGFSTPTLINKLKK